MQHILFAMILSLLFLHEMDAIRRKEWGMFLYLNQMPEERAYKVFTGLHLPLYFCIVLVLLLGENSAIRTLYYGIDFFLIGHGLIHMLFRKHRNNGFGSIFSKTIIYGMSFLAIIHLILMIGSI